ncbi:MAG: PilZ domain-containing protein [Deltaproteobacteria bacterium]|nr:PilZ domain-containing protein [Deltaproteobacteria bacterium]
MEPRRVAVGVDEIEAVFPSRKAFLQAAAVHATECRLYWAAPGATFNLNEQVRVILGFAGESVKFTFKGTIIKVVEEALRGQRTGAVIRIVGDEQAAFGSAVSYARGVDPALGRRASPRWNTRIAATLGDGLTRQAVLLDLSQGGAFAQLSSEPPPVGSLQPLSIDVGTAREVVPVRVAWIGRRDGKPGCGLEFLELGDKAKAWLQRQLESASRP